MCGICGIVNFSVREPVDRRVLERMTAVQAHRGPDDEGFFVENNAGLGHRRLSIIDLSGGKQPIFNEDESVAVVFNGFLPSAQRVQLWLNGNVDLIANESSTFIPDYSSHFRLANMPVTSNSPP